MLRLVNPQQPYAWGSATVIPELLGTAPTGDPVAELWLGAHPAAPSRTQDGTGLDVAIAKDPAGMLGTAVARRFGGHLPYLLKVLAADRPLSLQVHPTKDQARVGFAAEEAAAIPLTAPDRSYKDDNHKPEMLWALTPVEALCGFRSADAAEALLTGLDAPLARELGLILHARRGPEALPGAMQRLLDPDLRPAAAEVAAVVAACAARPAADSPDPAADQVVVRLAEAFPGDPGAVTSLLLNYVTLEPGEALYLPTGIVHAYLRGAGIEIMASSDNVLRAGLTTKHMDVPELLATIDHVAVLPARIPPRTSGATSTFRPPVAEFLLSVTTVEASADAAGTQGAADADARAGVPVPGAGPRILLCLTGEVTIRTAVGGSETLARGQSVFVPAADGAVTAVGAGTVAQADVP